MYPKENYVFFYFRGINMKWYAMFVKTGKEDYIRDSLLDEFSDDNIRIIVPKRILTEKKDGVYYEITRTVFPSYVFIKCNMNLQINKVLMRADKVYRILGDYFNPIPIPEKEMHLIDNVFKDKGVAGYTKIYYEGENTVIVEGPLKGYESNINKIDKRKNRAQVVFKLNGQEKKINFGIKFVSKE